MIHYMTSQGIGQPWVANELRIVQRAGIPFELHAMRPPAQIHFESAWARNIHEATSVLYPLSGLGTLYSLIRAPGLFGRLWSPGVSASPCSDSAFNKG